MPGPRKVLLTEQQQKELVKTRDHSLVPYMREKAAAILKVAEGKSMSQVGEQGLLRKVRRHAISEWIDRYEREGLVGLCVRPGRGRKPAFSPSA
jgi:transposase